MGFRLTRSGRAVGRTLLSVVVPAGLMLSLVGCQASPTVSPAATIPTGNGVVVGGIDACSGLPLLTNPGFVAGTVTVLRGTVSYVPEADGASTDVLPKETVAFQSVAKHQRYRFTLAPGNYVLTARYASGGNVEPWAPIIIRADKVTKMSIPNMCS
jgi:hypothetical protein